MNKGVSGVLGGVEWSLRSRSGLASLTGERVERNGTDCCEAWAAAFFFAVFLSIFRSLTFSFPGLGNRGGG